MKISLYGCALRSPFFRAYDRWLKRILTNFFPPIWSLYSYDLVTLFLRFGHFIPTVWLYSYDLVTLFLRFGQLKFSVGHFHYDHNPLNVPFYKKIKIKIMACFSTKLILREWIGNSLRRTREGTNCGKKRFYAFPSSKKKLSPVYMELDEIYIAREGSSSLKNVIVKFWMASRRGSSDL